MNKFKTSDGLSIHYTDQGDGLPILCLSGLTRTGTDFEYVMPHLAGNRVITMDYRGRGQSDFDENWRNYTLPIEGRDAIELMGHLGLNQVAILGTSRGGLNAMGLAKVAKQHLLGVTMNDIGPDLDPNGIDFIMQYLGRNPSAKTHEEAATALQRVFTDFQGVPYDRWLNEARKHYDQTEKGLVITYDPQLRDAVAASASEGPADLWPYFDALEGLPLCCIRGANSNLLTSDTLAEMRRRQPNMIVAEVPGRGHIPFLDEPEAVAALQDWIGQMK